MSERKISDVAKEVGVTPGTLRQWEKYGVLTPIRAPSGHRSYTPEQIDKANEIARLRNTGGLSLAEIKSHLGAAGASKDPLRGGDLTSRMLSPGAQVRRRRLERGLSLQKLASDLGISASTLSTFERTSKGASVKLLRTLADYFGITITQLSTAPQPSVMGPVRRNEGQRLTNLGEGIVVRAIATGDRMMDCKEWNLAPGAQSSGSYNHAGEEFVFVLSGCLELSVDGIGSVRLFAGDSLYFESVRKHSWINPGLENCQVLWVNTPASF